MNTKLEELLRQATNWFNSLPKSEQDEHLRRQAESWVRGEMAMGETSRMMPSASSSPPAPNLSVREEITVRFGEGSPTAWRLVISRELNSSHFCFALNWGEKPSERPTHTHYGMIPVDAFQQAIAKLAYPQQVE